MDQESKYISGVLIVVLTFMFYAVLDYWIKACSFDYIVAGQVILVKVQSKSLMLRFFFVVLVGLSVLLGSNKVRVREEYIKYSLSLCMLLLGCLVLLGCIGMRLYDMFLYPIIFFLYIVVTFYAIAVLRNSTNKPESIFGLTNEKSDFFFDFNTNKGRMTVHVPQQNIYIDGGPGSGKTVTFILPIIKQCAIRNYAGVIYDWEGDPTKEGSPILTKVAYACIKVYESKIKFAFINFTDMLRTVRVNVFSDKYVPRGNEALFIRNIAVTLMKNLEPSWKEKTDFWANNAINYVYSVAYKCYKERDKGINTLPHVIAMCLNDSDAVFKWLAEDKEISLNMSSMLTAWKMGAHQQTAGAVSSAQTPLAMLNNKNIFWVLSADEFDLDITNKNNPSLLCIGNAPMIKEAVSPAISCILSVVMSQMNNPGKTKSVFLMDEFPTIIINGIDIFIGTARKHFVSTILALQDYNQAVRDYGEKPASILKASCGSQFYGMTGNDNTAKSIQDLLGEIKEMNESFTFQDTGGGSISESFQNEKVVKGRDIAGQATGHFIGKVANGKPPYFREQFNKEDVPNMDIPPFSIMMDAGDPDVNNKLMDVIVQKNYDLIIAAVEQVLEAYK